MKRKDFDKKLANEEIGIEDLFNSTFMKKYTSFNNYEEIEVEINERATKSTDVEKLLKIIFKEKLNLEILKK